MCKCASPSFLLPPLRCVPPATVRAIYLYAPYRLGVVFFLVVAARELWVFGCVVSLRFFRFFVFFYFVVSELLLLLLLHLPPIEWRTSQNTLKSIDDNFYLYYCCCRSYFPMIGIMPCHPLALDHSANIARYLYVDILCLIEFRPDLNNEKTTR